MYPSTWVEFFGPSGWRFLHSIAFTFPESPSEEDRKKYIDFFSSVGNVLPCPACRAHYNKFLQGHPIEASSTDSMARWVYDLHDEVNKSKGKSSPTVEQVKDEYTGWNNDKQASLNRFSTEKKMDYLGNPRRPIAAEKQSGEPEGRSNLILFGLMAGALAFLIIRSRNKNENNKN